MKNLAALLALSLFALVACNGQGITVKGPKNSKSTTVTVIPAPTVTGLDCVPAQVYEGDSVTCTVTVDRAAPASGYTFPVLGGVGNPTSVTIAAGQTSASFTFAATIAVVAAADKAALWYVRGSRMHWTQAGVDAEKKVPGFPFSEYLTTRQTWLSVWYYRFL